jgi:hypothetical protein
MKIKWTKYIFEFIVIVFGISISFLIDDFKNKNELKSLSVDF